MTPDGRPRPTGDGGFAAAPGRYHLFVSLARPWAQRTLILRGLKGLQAAIGLSVTYWLMGKQAETVDFNPIKRHYQSSYATIDPNRIVPMFVPDFSA